MPRDLAISNGRLLVSADLAELAQPAAEWLDGEITRAIAERGRCSLCWREGGRRAGLSRAGVGRRIDWSKVDVFFGDERARSARSSREQLPHGARGPALPGADSRRPGPPHGGRAHRPGRGRAGVRAARCRRGSTSWSSASGPDGHTASLFPGSRRAGRAPPAGAAGDRDKPPAERLTITPPVIEAARRVAVIATGEDKARGGRARHRRAAHADESVPVQLARRGTWFLDQAAAAAMLTAGKVRRVIVLARRHRRHQRPARHRRSWTAARPDRAAEPVSEPRLSGARADRAPLLSRKRAAGPTGPASGSPVRSWATTAPRPIFPGPSTPDACRRDRDSPHHDHQRLRRGGLRRSSCWARPISATLQEGTPEPQGPIALIGAGTGLGQGFLLWEGDHYRVLPSEGGHSRLRPDAASCRAGLLEFLAREFGRVSWERLLSGPGIANTYRYLRASGVAPEQPTVRAEMDTEDAADGDRPARPRPDRFPLGSGAGSLLRDPRRPGGEPGPHGGRDRRSVPRGRHRASARGAARRAERFSTAFRDKGRMSDAARADSGARAS